MPSHGPTVRIGRRRARHGAFLHVHWFRWTRYDDFGPSSLYACRCGQVRPGL